MDNIEQKFLKQLDDKLWKAADKLRANLDAANYKHVVLGLIFLKLIWAFSAYCFTKRRLLLSPLASSTFIT